MDLVMIEKKNEQTPPLKNSLKWNIVLAIGSSLFFSNQEKQAIFQKVKSEDNSDFGSRV